MKSKPLEREWKTSCSAHNLFFNLQNTSTWRITFDQRVLLIEHRGVSLGGDELKEHVQIFCCILLCKLCIWNLAIYMCTSWKRGKWCRISRRRMLCFLGIRIEESSLVLVLGCPHITIRMRSNMFMSWRIKEQIWMKSHSFGLHWISVTIEAYESTHIWDVKCL